MFVLEGVMNVSKSCLRGTHSASKSKASTAPTHLVAFEPRATARIMPCRCDQMQRFSASRSALSFVAIIRIADNRNGSSFAVRSMFPRERKRLLTMGMKG